MSAQRDVAVAKQRILLGEIAGDSQRAGETGDDFVATLAAMRDAIDRAISYQTGEPPTCTCKTREASRG